MLWILFTILATFFQTFRNIEQKHLGKKIDALSASWSRFILPFPLAIITVFYTAKNINHDFLIACLICSTLQILGNVLMIKTLQYRNFSIGVAFCKTEALQSVMIGFLIFNQFVSNFSVISIFIATFGVILISNLKFKNGFKGFISSLKSPATGFGLMSGFCFSITGFNIKNATIALFENGFNQIQAGFITLFWIIFLQNFCFAIIKTLQQRFKKDLKLIFNLENKIGFYKTAIFSFCGSIFWFLAYSYGEVILVKTLGQIELVFALLVSQFYFKEKHHLKEIIGIFLIITGIILVLNFQ
jgi:drug/metabolite transporter (DMT)-like permease